MLRGRSGPRGCVPRALGPAKGPGPTQGGCQGRAQGPRLLRKGVGAQGSLRAQGPTLTAQGSGPTAQGGAGIATYIERYRWCAVHTISMPYS